MLSPLHSPSATSVAPPARRSRGLLWLRVLLVYGCLEGALWTERPLRDLWSLLAALLIAAFLAVDLYSGARRLRDLGLGLRGLRRTLWIPAAAALLAAVIVAAGWSLHTLHHLFGPASYYAHASGYAFWTVVQEFIAQSFFFLTLEELLSPGAAILGNGLLFAIAHLPNPVLVPVTLAGGWILTFLFSRYRNIYLLAVAHTLVALSIAVSVPDAVQRHMRVGIGYQHYHAAPSSPSPVPPSRTPVVRHGSH